MTDPTDEGFDDLSEAELAEAALLERALRVGSADAELRPMLETAALLRVADGKGPGPAVGQEVVRHLEEVASRSEAHRGPRAARFNWWLWLVPGAASIAGLWLFVATRVPGPGQHQAALQDEAVAPAATLAPWSSAPPARLEAKSKGGSGSTPLPPPPVALLRAQAALLHDPRGDRTEFDRQMGLHREQVLALLEGH